MHALFGEWCVIFVIFLKSAPTTTRGVGTADGHQLLVTLAAKQMLTAVAH